MASLMKSVSKNINQKIILMENIIIQKKMQNLYLVIKVQEKFFFKIIYFLTIWYVIYYM
jgi:hypothetical protein